MSDELRVAIEAAKVGAQEALKYYNLDLKIEKKEDKSVFSIADTKTEEVIKTQILSYFPNAQFLAEESGGNVDNESLWIIDPIDGTRSFLRGIDTWSVLVSYYTNSQVIVGVCYFPLMNILLYAKKGDGAFCNNERIHVSKINDPSTAFLAYGGIRHFKNKQPLLNLIERFESARSPEPTYSAYLVSTGKMDVFVDAYGRPWDTLPFVPIIEEAGGKMTNWKSEPLMVTDKGSVATNGLLHDEVIRVLNEKS